MTALSRKEEAAIRRDARHTKNEARPRPKAVKKDTKRWCRGKVGVEHTPKCMPWATPIRAPDARVLACTKCGKELAHYLPWPRSKPKPLWWE